jgi:hypothetical protein
VLALRDISTSALLCHRFLPFVATMLLLVGATLASTVLSSLPRSLRLDLVHALDISIGSGIRKTVSQQIIDVKDESTPAL